MKGKNYTNRLFNSIFRAFLNDNEFIFFVFFVTFRYVYFFATENLNR